MRADKETVTRLLKTARGQLDGVLRMVDDDAYCIDVANQIAAAGAVLRRANREILRAHLDGCVREAFREGDDAAAEEKIDEILSVMDTLSR